MIKFLHTADIHLGKVFYEQSLADDQAAVLQQLAEILKDDSYSALVIAGDIYDRSIPSPEAVELFGSFLATIKRRTPSLEVLVISGNHDSASRLGFGRELFARLGIRFGVEPSDCDKPVIVEKYEERCAFFLLPFLHAGALERDGESSPLRSLPDLAEEAGRRIQKVQRDLEGSIAYSVLVSHLFASGGTEAGSERVFLGSAELVNLPVLGSFDYIALGHLHRCQRIGDTAWYSGSPLAYSFNEASSSNNNAKCFLSVELEGGKASVRQIPIKPLRNVTSLSVPFARFTAATLDSEVLDAQDDYLELCLTDRGITENALEILRRRFPHLLSLRQDTARAGLSSSLNALDQAENQTEDNDNARGLSERRNVSSDFKNFLTALYGEANTEELADEGKLFDTLLAEVEAEEQTQ